MWEESDRPLEWYVPLWKFIGDYHWLELKSLRLDGLVVCEKGLADFLGRHAKTLRSLELFSIALWHGSFRGLLSGLRSSLKLNNFHIWGILRSFHSPHEAWKLRPRFNDIPEWWSSEFTSFMEGHMREIKKKAQVNCKIVREEDDYDDDDDLGGGWEKWISIGPEQ